MSDAIQQEKRCQLLCAGCDSTRKRLPEALSVRGGGRFRSHGDRDTLGAQAVCKQVHLRGFARTVHAVKNKEQRTVWRATYIRIVHGFCSPSSSGTP